jgi:hypothetical protein
MGRLGWGGLHGRSHKVYSCSREPYTTHDVSHHSGVCVWGGAAVTRVHGSSVYARKGRKGVLCMCEYCHVRWGGRGCCVCTHGRAERVYAVLSHPGRWVEEGRARGGGLGWVVD